MKKKTKTIALLAGGAVLGYGLLQGLSVRARSPVSPAQPASQSLSNIAGDIAGMGLFFGWAGAAVGALIGWVVTPGHRGKGALVGAAAGFAAVAGSAIPYDAGIWLGAGEVYDTAMP